MNPNRYDIWDVNGAAEKLIAQAHTLSTRHLSHGMARVQFNQEVAWYAKRIADDVAQGRKPRSKAYRRCCESSVTCSSNRKL